MEVFTSLNGFTLCMIITWCTDYYLRLSAEEVEDEVAALFLLEDP